MPPALLAAIPKLYSQENTLDPIVCAKFFTPDAGATWLVIEGEPSDDGEDFMFFGFVCLGPHMADCAELGYFYLNELREVRGGLGLPVERDLYFTPKPLSRAKKDLGL